MCKSEEKTMSERKAWKIPCQPRPILSILRPSLGIIEGVSIFVSIVTMKGPFETLEKLGGNADWFSRV